MSTIIKVGTIRTAQLLKMDRAISRDIELENGLRINHHRVQKSKKTYSRKSKHTQNIF